MAELKVPSLQHLARNSRNDPERVMALLVRLALNPPRFNYNPLYAAMVDLFIMGVPYADVEQGIRTKIKRASVRDNLLSVLPLIRDHFEDKTPDFYQVVDRRYYSVGRGLLVPFEPPMIYGISGQLYFPWFSFWRKNPLAKERLSLFVTVVDELLMDDPDLETARFEILDFSVNKNGKRELSVVDAKDVPRLSNERKIELLNHFAEGFFRAQEALKKAPKAEKQPEDRRDPDQWDFFDEPPPPGK
jgi:hypothetical protein